MGGAPQNLLGAVYIIQVNGALTYIFYSSSLENICVMTAGNR
jgi:hypothetical protein